MRGHARFYDTNSTDPIRGVARFQVRSFASGATVQCEDGDKVALTLQGEAIEGPFEKIQIAGVATLRIWTDKGGPLPTFSAPPSGTATLELGAVVTVTNAAGGSQLLVRNDVRRSIGLQNQSVRVVKICSDAACTNVLATLAACAVAYDGTGGSFSLSGYTGPLYAIAATAPSDVSVVAY